MLSRIIPVSALFLLTLLYFVFSIGWYEPAQLVIRGVAPDMSADVGVKWDSGSGFNEYQSERFLINTVTPDNGIHTVIVRALGEKHRHSESTAIELTAVYLDGREFELSTIEPRSILRDRLAIHLTESGQTYRFDAKAEKSIRLEFSSSFYFGKAEIRINGVSSVHDFYSSGTRLDTKVIEYWIMDPEGQFTVSMDLPRYSIKDLVIANRNPGQRIHLLSALLQSPKTSVELPVPENQDMTQVSFSGLNRDLKRYFHPSHFLLQACFAALSTWIIFSGLQFVRQRGGLTGIVLDNKRYIFWIFFAGAAAVYSIWLAAFWPGVMSIDSLKIWRAASLPGVFINDHPVLNMIFYMFLLHIWNNIAVVPLAHIFLVSLLVAYVFFMLYRRGVSPVLLIPCYLCVIFSIPVGLYNTLLWKDIPYALLVVFWGITLVRLNIRKREGNARFSRQEILALFLLYLALGLVRHNGLIYLAVVPLFLLMLGPIKKRTVVLVMISSILIGGLLMGIYRHPPQFLKGQFLYHISHGYVEKLKDKPVKEQVVRAGIEYLEIFDMEKEGTTSDRFHYYLEDRYAYTFLRIAGFNDVYPYIDPEPPFPAMRNTAMNVYEKSYAKPWYYVVWNPVFMLAIVPLAIIAFRWLPNTAMYSSFIFIGAITLVFLQVFNWRYYYFYYFGLYFVLPMIFLDMKFFAKHKLNR